MAQGAGGIAFACAEGHTCWGAALAQATASLTATAWWRPETSYGQSWRRPRAELAQTLPFTEGNSEDQRRAMPCPRSHSTSAAEPGPATGPPDTWPQLSPASGHPLWDSSGCQRDLLCLGYWGFSLRLDLPPLALHPLSPGASSKEADPGPGHGRNLPR